MKRLVLTVLCFLLVTGSCFCAKPCKGLCGFRLGEKIDLDKVELEERDNAGQATYKAKAYDKFMDFDHVEVETLRDNTIYSVMVSSDKKPSEADSYFKKVISVIDSHYDVKQSDKEPVITDSAVIATYSFPDNIGMNISKSILTDDITLVAIYVVDLSLKEKVKKAKKKVEIGEIDTSALE